MPQYTVEAPDGRRVTLEGDSEPTESDLDEVFKSLPAATPSGGGFGKLREAEANIRPAAPEPEKGWFARLTENPGGEADISGGIGGGVAPEADPELNRQAIRSNAKLAGTLASVAAPAAVPGLALGGAGSLGGLAARMAAQGAVGGAAGGVAENAPLVAAGEETPAQAAKNVAVQTGIGTVAGPVIGLPLAKAGQVAESMIEAGAGNRTAGALAGISRNLVETPESIASRAADDVIESISGTRPAKSAGQAIRSMEREQATPGVKGELTPEERNANIRKIFADTAGLRERGLSKEQIADIARGALQREGVELNEPVKKALEAFNARLDRVSKGVSTTAQAATKPATPRTTAEAGERVRELAANELDAAETAWNTAFEKLRQNPEYSSTPVTLSATKRWADTFGSQGLKNAQGEAVSVIPKETRTQVADILAAVDNQSLDDVRKFKTQVARSIKLGEVLPGLDSGAKKQLVMALQEDIESAVNKLPSGTLKTDLQAANKAYSSQVDRFKGPLSESILRDVGAERGASGQRIYDAIVGKQGVSNLGQIRKLLGASSDEGIEAIRSGLLGEIQRNATDTAGQISVGKMVKQLSDLPPEVANELYPGLSNLRRLAQREAGLQQVASMKPDELISTLRATPEQVTKWLSGGSTTKEITDLLSAQSKADRGFANEVLRDVAKGNAERVAGNPQQFLNGVFGGKYRSSDIGRTMQVLSRQNPLAAEQVQNEYLTTLLENSQTKGVFDARRVLQSIGSPSASGSGGTHYDLANEILGKAKADTIRTVARQLQTAQKDVFLKQVIEPGIESDAAFLAGKAAGASAPIRLFRDVIQWLPNERYKLAARLLNTQSLRELALKPASEWTATQAQAMANAVNAAAAEHKQQP